MNLGWEGKKDFPEDIMLQLRAEGWQELTGAQGPQRTFQQKNTTFKGHVVEGRCV